MIRVKITRDAATGTIRSFDVNGHANFDDPGKDIVCAGVSAVTFGTVNAVEALTGSGLECKVGKRGELSARLPQVEESPTGDRTQLLLESMLVMLRTIEQSYGEFISIQEEHS